VTLRELQEERLPSSPLKRHANGAVPSGSPLKARRAKGSLVVAEVQVVVTPRPSAPPAAPPAEVKEEIQTNDTDCENAIDDILSMAFDMERKIKEAEEDERALPGSALSRCAAQTTRRLRKKSKELEVNFQAIMGKRLEAVFRRFDTDKSGSLDPTELKAAFEAAGRPSDDETISKAMAALDTNNDGLVDLDEFKALAWKCSAPF
jgi:hypothetical protein